MAEKKAIPAVGRNRGLGMVMHRKVVDELKRLGLSCHPYLTVVFQQKQKRWMLAGEEGGGSTADVGHYVGFTGVTPSGIAVSIPIQSLVPNSTQRRVIAQEMIRAQIFRYGNSCNLLVTYHWLNSAGDSERPTLGSHRLFYHRNGILAPGTKQPVFFDRAGEPIDTPPELVPLRRAFRYRPQFFARRLSGAAAAAADPKADDLSTQHFAPLGTPRACPFARVALVFCHQPPADA